MAGADIVTQGEDYLDHTWRPHPDARRFEYSTPQLSYAVGLARCLSDIFVPNGIEAIAAETRRLQDVFLAHLDRDLARPIVFPAVHRSGILSLAPGGDLRAVVRRLAEVAITATTRGGYLRIAPHFYNDDEEMIRTATALNDSLG